MQNATRPQVAYKANALPTLSLLSRQDASHPQAAFPDLIGDPIHIAPGTRFDLAHQRQPRHPFQPLCKRLGPGRAALAGGGAEGWAAIVLPPGGVPSRGARLERRSVFRSARQMDDRRKGGSSGPRSCRLRSRRSSGKGPPSPSRPSRQDAPRPQAVFRAKGLPPQGCFPGKTPPTPRRPSPT